MRFVVIALFIFSIQVSASLINSLGIMHYGVQPMDEWFNKVNSQQIEEETYSQGAVTSGSSDFGFGDFVKGLFYFIASFALGVIAVPYTLAQFGLTSPYIYIFSLPVYLIYFLAIAQFLANRGIKTMW